MNPVFLSGMSVTDPKTGDVRAEAIAEVREQLAFHKVHMTRGKTDTQFIRLMVKYVGDADLAATAILMNPRPKWVYEIIADNLMVRKETPQ